MRFEGPTIDDRRRVEVGGEGDAGQRRVPPVGAAHDPHPLRVGDALGDQVLDAPGDVVLHLVAPLLVAGVQELLAVAGRPAEVGLEDGVAAVGQELGEVVEAPAVARPGTAVRQHHGGQALRGDALRQGEEGGDLEPVRGRVAHRLHLRHVLARDALAHLVLQDELLGRPVEQVPLARIRVARGGDEHDPVVGGGGAEVDVLARELALEQLVVGLPRLVAEVDARPLVLVGGADELVGGLGEDRPAEVHAAHRVGLDQLLLAGLGVEEHEAREVDVALVRLHVDAPGVLVEAVGAAGLEHAAGVDGLEAVREDLQAPRCRPCRSCARPGGAGLRGRTASPRSGRCSSSRARASRSRSSPCRRRATRRRGR